GGDPLEQPAPAAFARDRDPKLVGAVAVDFEATMLELDPCPRALGDEAHLHLGRKRRIRVVLPLRPEVPAEHDTLWRIPREHAAPLAFAPIRGTLEPATAGLGLDDHLVRLALTDVMGVQRPPARHPAGEHLEGPFRRYVDGDRLAHHL